MDRLVERIKEELVHITFQNVEIYVLDGNGDSFKVFDGSAKYLSPFHFRNVLRDPGCFYFFNISSTGQNKNRIFRELCWLTDPLPPTVSETSSTSITANWNTVKFCGVNSPTSIDSVIYTLEICEGVDFKEGKMSKYMNDIIAMNYKPVCSRANLLSVIIRDLQPSKWYHLRLEITYLGLKVLSESISVHTEKYYPSIPGTPQMYALPPTNMSNVIVDGKTMRNNVLITWHSSNPNGSNIIKYQLQLRRIDSFRKIIRCESPLEQSKKQFFNLKNNEINDIFNINDSNKRINQWVKSPNRSAIQIRNSLNSREKISSASSKIKKKKHLHQIFLKQIKKMKIILITTINTIIKTTVITTTIKTSTAIHNIKSI